MRAPSAERGTRSAPLAGFRGQRGWGCLAGKDVSLAAARGAGSGRCRGAEPRGCALRRALLPLRRRARLARPAAPRPSEPARRRRDPHPFGSLPASPASDAGGSRAKEPRLPARLARRSWALRCRRGRAPRLASPGSFARRSPPQPPFTGGRWRRTGKSPPREVLLARLNSLAVISRGCDSVPWWKTSY